MTIILLFALKWNQFTGKKLFSCCSAVVHLKINILKLLAIFRIGPGSTPAAPITCFQQFQHFFLWQLSADSCFSSGSVRYCSRPPFVSGLSKFKRQIQYFDLIPVAAEKFRKLMKPILKKWLLLLLSRCRWIAVRPGVCPAGHSIPFLRRKPTNYRARPWLLLWMLKKIEMRPIG